MTEVRKLIDWMTSTSLQVEWMTLEGLDPFDVVLDDGNHKCGRPFQCTGGHPGLIGLYSRRPFHGQVCFDHRFL